MTLSEWMTLGLSVLTLVAGGGWLFDRRKHRQEVESLRADNRQKEMDLSKDYVASFRKEIAEPLRQEMEQLRTEVSELRKENASLRRETGSLKKEIKQLKDAIQKINDCPHAADCPVYDELQKHQGDDPADCK